jgi:hypothetical protein
MGAFMASINNHDRTERHRSGSFFSGTALVLLAIVALAIGTMFLGGFVGMFTGDEAPIASNDGAPTIGVEDPNIVVEQPSGAEVAPLTTEAQGETMTTVPTNPVDATALD